MERAELLAAIEEGWRDWQNLLASLTPKELVDPALPGGWSVKDAIAHIAFYEGWGGEFIRTRAWPAPKHPSLDTWDIDARNDAFFELNRHRSLDDLLEESHREHHVLVEALSALTDEEYRDKHLLGQPPDEDWCVEKMVDGNTYKHYPEHIEVIDAWLASTR